jgi:hypothetical protein
LTKEKIIPIGNFACLRARNEEPRRRSRKCIMNKKGKNEKSGSGGENPLYRIFQLIYRCSSN